MLKVFLSGPYSANPLSCTETAISIANEIRDRGHAVFVPHLSHFWDELYKRDYDDWMTHDLVWLRVCDVMVRVPGESPGADIETEYANINGIMWKYWPCGDWLDWLVGQQLTDIAVKR